jgi:hypothetical protein
MCGGERELASQSAPPVDAGSGAAATSCAASALRAQHDVAGICTADGRTAAVAYLVSRSPKSAAEAKPPAAEAKPPSQPEPPERSLCEQRKDVNAYLCNVLGSLVAWRAMPSTARGAFGGAHVSMIVGDSCKQAMDWLEDNAPGGACR